MMAVKFGLRLALMVAFVLAFGIMGNARGGASDDAATCLTSEGKTACGYHCLASSGQVQCSLTPQGICIAAPGTVACWDPPPLLRGLFAGRVPRPQCVTSSMEGSASSTPTPTHRGSLSRRTARASEIFPCFQPTLRQSLA